MGGLCYSSGFKVNRNVLDTGSIKLVSLAAKGSVEAETFLYVISTWKRTPYTHVLQVSEG